MRFRHALVLAFAGCSTVLTALLVLATPAHAQAIDVQNSVSWGSVITLDAAVVAILAGFVTPLLTGLLTKYGASSGLKAIVALVLTAVAAVVNTVVMNDGTFVIKDLLVVFFVTIGAHVSSYSLLYKPVDVAEVLAPSKGLGTDQSGGDDGAPLQLDG